MKNKKTQAVLNQAVADLSQFAAIIHQAHWYMRGSRFLSLHPKMDEYMEEINLQPDEIAERLITLGGAPYSTLQDFSSNSNLKVEKSYLSVTMDAHLEKLLEGYQYISQLYKEGIDTAAEEEDDVTEDLFTGLKGPIDKNIWMISATLDRDPEVNN